MKRILKKILVSLLLAEAKLALKRHSPRVVAVTGSVGKTSTKDAIAGALSKAASVRKSEKSFNSDIGIPLTILGLKNPWSNPLLWIVTLVHGLRSALASDFPETLVLEVGADRPGDISSLSRWLKTDVVVATQFAKVPVHIENFSSREAVLEEKLSLLHTLKPAGVIVLNADDVEFTERVNKLNRNAVVFTYGLLPPATVLGSNEKYIFDKHGRVKGFSFKLEHAGAVFPLEIEGAVGSTHVYPNLAGFTVGVALGVNPVTLLEGLRDVERQPGRMKLIGGIKKTMIIDDSYNSSPVATARALETLEAIPSNGKKIVMLGDMLELGTHTKSEHEKAGAKVAHFADLLVAVGKYAQHTVDGALRGGMAEKYILQFDTAEEAGKYVELLIKAGDTILIKGSQGTRMEKAVLEIMDSPERREKLLTRQDKEWEKR
jgi:UDP-N-acetylmuramoyl-tripeptide--D-alanyl-D-alanine ligase